MFDYVVSIDQCHGRRPFPGVAMFATEAEKMTLSIVEMEPHSVIPEHSHPHEQIGYMVQGEFEFQIGGKSYRVRPGQIWRIPGGVAHKVIAGANKVRAVDVFYPIRDDMRPAGSATPG
jgi:quercetin dioxygenase-like cupin family protein